jgi:predicted permease
VTDGRLVVALYRRLLDLYPRRARERFGAEQLALFEAMVREERPRQPRALVWTAAQLWRALVAAAMAHLDEHRRARSPETGSHMWSLFRPGPFWRDVRTGIRSLRATPWYSASVVAVLAIGLALATVVFAVVDGVLFKPLPYPRAHELFLVRVGVAGASRPQPPPITGREVDAWKDAAPDVPLTRIRQYSHWIATVGARQFYATAVDARFFDVVTLRAWLGGFTTEDFVARSPEADPERFPRALISHRFWLAATGGSTKIINQRLPLNGAGDRGVTVAGILPRDFVFPLNVVDSTALIRQPDILFPLPPDAPENRDFAAYLVLARISRTEALAAVRERFRRATLELTRHPPPIDVHHADQRRPPYDLVELEPILSHLGTRERPTFSLVAAATGLLLALICVNLAALTAARSVNRQRDLVIRLALGASSWQLIRGAVAELLVLVGAGAVVAVLGSPLLLRWSLGLLPDAVTLLKEPGLDGRVLAGTTTVALASAVLVAAWPALITARVSTLSASGRLDTASTRLGRRSGLVLVSTQAMLGFILLTAGGLTIASIAAAWRSDVGYRRDRVVIFEAFLKNHATVANDAEHVAALHQTLSQVTGVSKVAFTSFQMFLNSDLVWTGVKPAGTKSPPQGVASRHVSAEFFDVMDLPFVAGEGPSAAEWRTNQLAIVSESAARLLWPDRPAIGQLLMPIRLESEGPQSWRVAGVVRDARYRAVDREPVADVYLPDRIDDNRYGAFFLVRTSDDSERVIPRLMALAAARGFWTETVAPLDEALFATMRPRFLPAWLFGSLGVVGLVVMAAGAFGLLAMSAAQRTREIVIRTALGASPGRVLWLLGRDQVTAVAIGIGIGGLVSLWAMRAIRGHLYGVGPQEPAIWTAVAVGMLMVAAIGTLLPAVHAVRVDPAQALRVE